MAYVDENLATELTITSPKEVAQVKEEASYASSERTAKSDQLPEKHEENDIQLPTIHDDHDGGYGWLVVLGAFCVQVTSFGIVSSVMQDYFHQNLFENDPQAQVNLSFVGSLALIFINASSPLVQILVARYGLRPIMIMGTLFITIALEMAGFAYKIWHLYLTQGILFGIGASCMYVTVMSVTPQWFTKNRGIALGIVAGGSGMGGLILPFIVTPINRNLGPGWTYRILGFICMVCDIIACIFVRERIPRKREKKKLSDVLQFSVLKDVNFLIFSIGSDIALLGYFIPFFFVPSYATYLGMSDSQGSALVAVISALNFIGRLIAGFLADRFGRLNSNIFFTFLAAISCLLIWTFAFSYGSLMAFSAVFGLSCGSYFALMSPISASLLGMEKFPSGLSLLLLFNSITVFGSNISSAIEAATTASPYFSYKMFAGLSYLIGGFILLIVKFRINRNPFVKV